MDKALDTLFYPYEHGDLDYPAPDQSVLFLNAQYHKALENLKLGSLRLQQYFKPFANTLQEHGLPVSSDIPAGEALYDRVLIKLPKSQIEARYLIAQGFKALKNEGIIICAADNKAGGTRISKTLKEFGISNVQDQSKNKARVCYGVKDNFHPDALESALKLGSLQTIPDGRFISIPGLFGWDKIDIGSSLLSNHLPKTLSGRGADFGCGYGFLSHYVLEHCPAIAELICIDADWRAISVTQENLKAFDSASKRYFWEDLTQSQQSLVDLDFIIMNPPFHEGKATNSDMGRSFIRSAFESLRPKGALWMVANAHLPYEEALKEAFQTVEKPFEGEGFKIFHAIK